MRRLAAIKNWGLAACLIAFQAAGQTTFSGKATDSGQSAFASGNACAPPNFCAYNGLDVIPWGTVPVLGGAINNGATIYDTSYLGHMNGDGATTFNNAALLSSVTRLTDSVSAAGKTNVNFAAGMGGSGAFTLTNTNTTLVRTDQSSLGMICAFATSGANRGHCGTPPGGWAGTPPASGVFITTGQLVGGSCSSNCPVNDFGSVSFSLTDPTVLYTFGNDQFDISTPLTVTPYTINPNTGAYSLGSTLVDFQYGLPMGPNALTWTASTNYPYGSYVTHILGAPGSSLPEYSNYSASTSYSTGDIIVPYGGACMYRAIVAGSTNGTLLGASSFDATAPCQNEIVKETAPSTLQWRGTNSGPQFIYQNMGAAGVSAGSPFRWISTPATVTTSGAMASGSAILTSGTSSFTASMVGQAISVSSAGNASGTTPLFTTIISYQNSQQVTLATKGLQIGGTSAATILLTGHPDVMSSTVGDAHGIVWVNVGTSYPVANGNQLWTALGGISRDTLYGGYASKFGLAISTNSYGLAPTYSKYTSDQGTGAWLEEYDHVSNVYHLLNSLTGIWTDWACSSGTDYSCSAGTRTPTTVGTLNAVANPSNSSPAQPCPFYVHNLKLSTNGLYGQITSQANVYSACNSLQNFLVWQPTSSSFDTNNSLQFTFAGMNHWAIGTNKIVAYNGSAFGYTAGMFTSVYNAANASTIPKFSVYLKPVGNAGASITQTAPAGCYVSTSATENPDCNLSEVLDSHLSMAGDPGSDTYPACGTSFNYATLGPAVNAWQNMETCYQTSPSYDSTALPSTSVGNVWQFTHTFATGTSATFSTQFQISEYSQDANWLFWSSDWNCQNGSTTGIAPTVWTSGTFVDMLAVAASPANPTSVCGLPWAASHTYVVGNMIDPIEGTGGAGAVDDVFQAIYVGGPTGANQPGPALPNSYFSTSIGPTTTAPGNTICDSASGSSMNPIPPYTSSCPTGMVWQDIGPQNQRGDVFAVNLGHI
jgi:hypothetical protein